MIQKWIIRLNSETVTNINQEINIGDKLEIDLPKNQKFVETIKRVFTFKPVIVAFNKPKWYTVSKEDKFNQTIYDILPDSWRKDFYYIWRLDKESHWLLLLTNDTKLVDFYENPKNRIIKIYEVLIDKPFKSKDIIKSKRWILVDQEWRLIDPNKPDKEEWTELLTFHDVQYSPDKWHFLRILLTEWKKRHIRRLLSALGYKVKDLKRIKVWKYELWTVKPWQYRIYKT